MAYLFQEVPDSDYRAEEKAHQIVCGEGVVDDVLVALIVATSSKFYHLHFVRDNRDGSWYQGSDNGTEKHF